MRAKIVWIEDDIPIISPIVAPLQREGYDIVGFRTVREALDHAETVRDCDLIILDLILPPGSDEEWGRYPGFELLGILRARHGVRAPVVVLSGRAIEDAIGNRVQTLGIAAVLMKPCRASELLSTVQTVLRDH